MFTHRQTHRRQLDWYTEPSACSGELKSRLTHDAARIKSVKLAKTKALISCAITVQLICSFDFAYTKNRFSHDAALKKVFLFSTNKGADQLRVFRVADLCLCFHICKSRFSHVAANVKYIGANQLRSSAAYPHMQKPCFLMIRYEVCQLSTYRRLPLSVN